MNKEQHLFCLTISRPTDWKIQPVAERISLKYGLSRALRGVQHSFYHRGNAAT